MNEEVLKQPRWDEKKKYTVLGFSLFILLGVWIYFHAAPINFPQGEVITIIPGESLQEIATYLHYKSVIKSPFVFRIHVILQGGERRVIAGDYLLDKKEGTADIAYRLVHGQFNLPTVKITIPEGWNTFQIADHLKKTLISFDKTYFIKLAKPEEGYLFPDTYFVSSAVRSEDIISRMKKTFQEKIVKVPGIGTTTRKLSDIITMASILEDEAPTTKDRQMISDILWRRISLGLALQVDSTFLYINGKNTYDLTAEDLKINSPYNTYLYRGLPPTPIGNPGTDAIFAAINPLKNKYLYYLSGKDGVIHYATTFEQHKKNRELYLK